MFWRFSNVDGFYIHLCLAYGVWASFPADSRVIIASLAEIAWLRVTIIPIRNDSKALSPTMISLTLLG